MSGPSSLVTDYSSLVTRYSSIVRQYARPPSPYHIDRDLVEAAFRDDDVGVAFARLDEFRCIGRTVRRYRR